MLTGKLYKRSRPSACLLCRIQLPSTILARSSGLASQHRFQSEDAAKRPSRPWGQSPVFGRVPQSLDAFGNSLQQAQSSPNRPPVQNAQPLRPPPPAAPPRPPPAFDFGSRPSSGLGSSNAIGGGWTSQEDNSNWGQLTPRRRHPPAPHRHAGMGRHQQPGPFDSANQRAPGPDRPDNSMPRRSPGGSSFWSELDSRIQKTGGARRNNAIGPNSNSIGPDKGLTSSNSVGPGPGGNNRPSRDNQFSRGGNGWNNQIGGDPSPRRQDPTRAQQSDWDWSGGNHERGPSRRDARSQRPPQRQRQDSRRPPPRQAQSQRGGAPAEGAPAVESAVNLEPMDDAVPYFPDELDSLETQQRKRKDRAMEKERKTKTKTRRRNTGYNRMDEDDEYDEFSDRAEERRRRKEEKKRQKEMELEAAAKGPIPILLPGFISVGNLGIALRVKPHIFLMQLGELGFEDITTESIMTGETAALIAQEYGYEPTVDIGEKVDLRARPPPADPSILPARPPIVTIMGHVDHGKTTMLDWLRKSSVVAQEHGGITQHIGAFSVKLSSGKQITFLDTPGHAAFLTMRQRGANVTDIVILVVAADDSVKPQTLEALKHAQGAKVPIIVAINKIDKDEARVEQVKSDLARHGVEIEDFGGDVQVVCVSGRTGQGMDDLEENILTLSEILDVRAETDGMAEGWVLESSVKSVGRSASVLVKRGTLRKGDIIAAGTTWAKIRVMRNEAGVEIEEAPPATPVEILGWKDLPDAGDEVLQAPNEARVKEALEYREEIKDRGTAATEYEAQERREREKAVLDAAKKEAEEEKKKNKKGDNETAKEDEAVEEDTGPTTVNFTVKGDVTGSVEAVCAAIQEIGNHEVQPKILRSTPGAVTEFDVEHAAATGSAIVNFNMPVPPNIKHMAEGEGVPIMDHTVIYHLIDDVKKRLSEKLAPLVTSRVLGEAEVLQIFPINIRGRVYKNIAGCRIRNGLVTRAGMYRVFRKGEKVFDGKLESLKQGKKEVAEIRKGAECGMGFEEWQDMEVGDTIQAYEEVTEKRYL